MPVILLAYLFVSWIIGKLFLQRLIKGIPSTVLLIGSFIVGTLVSVPLTYGVSILFGNIAHPMMGGVVGTTVLLAIVEILALRKRSFTIQKPMRFDLSFVMLVLFSFGVSSWIMTKTFHGDVSGQLFVGSNNVFDFSHALGVVRSFSFGSNVPFMSPFQAGLPYLYHFFFSFYVGIWEYFGVPILVAMNVPSILSFAAFLIMVYTLPQYLFKQSKVVGWISVFFVVTNSTLTWFQLFAQKGISFQTLRALWTLPTYPFAGPFDGSTISLFMTLNNFVNQRHLAFAIASSLLLVMVIIKQIEQKEMTWKKIVLDGLLFGLLGMWNIAIALISTVSILLVLLYKKYWRYSVLFGATVGTVLGFYVVQYLYMFPALVAFSSATVALLTPTSGIWNAAYYLWMNLSVLPAAVVLGYVVLDKKIRMYGFPFLLLGLLLCCSTFFAHQGFDQKFLSYLIVWADIFAAIGIGWLIQKKTILARICAVCLFIVLTVSGVIDLIPIKNEFAYPLVDTRMLPVITWIRTYTPKNAVFVSYSDMVDPVAFAGRKNYYGFFGNIGAIDRSDAVKRIYAGDISTLNNLGITYILVPKWEKNDFPYYVDEQKISAHTVVAYEDAMYRIYSSVVK